VASIASAANAGPLTAVISPTVTNAGGLAPALKIWSSRP
jgi:hypothetical protein